MRNHLLLAIALLAAACDKKDASAPAPKPVEPSAGPAAPVAPPAPTASVYSPEAAAKLLADLDRCEYDFNCDAYKPLVSFGVKVAPGLVKVAADPARPTKARSIAAKALTEIKDPAAGKPLFEAARAEKDFMLRGDLYAAAGATGSDDVLAAAGALLLTDEGWEQRTELGKAIEPFGKKAFDWAVGELPRHLADKFDTSLVDIITAVAGPADAAKLKELAGKVKQGDMAHNRLARKLVELGDTAQLDVLVAGLSSDDEFVRSDAGNMLAEVVDKLPADQKAKVVDLVKAAKAKDKGGLTSAGYDRVLKKLGAE